jgi:hypothetical protein
MNIFIKTKGDWLFVWVSKLGEEGALIHEQTPEHRGRY